MAFLEICREKEFVQRHNSNEQIRPANDHLKQFLTEWQTIEYPPFHAFSGGNDSTEVILLKTNGRNHLIPPKCKYFNTDIEEFYANNNLAKAFDLIILDPPWWNKAVRRSRHVQRKNG